MSVSGNDIVAYAAQQLGKPYVWGSEGPGTFDCSGLVQYVYRHFGISVPRVTGDQVHVGQEVARTNLQPGDLIFSHWGSNRPASHVGIYAGNGRLINAPKPGTVVRYATLSSDYWAHVDAVRRVPGVSGYTGSTSSAGAATGTIPIPIAPGVTIQLPTIPTPGDLIGAVGGVATAVNNAAAGLLQVGNAATVLTRAFLPGNLLRASAGLAGALFILIGVWFLSREVRQ